MNQAVWLASEEPASMLAFLQDIRNGVYSGDKVAKWGDRKMRLFACACCRQGWGWLRYTVSRRAVQVAEWYADDGSGDTRKCPWYPDAVMTDRGYMQLAEREAEELAEATDSPTAGYGAQTAAACCSWNPSDVVATVGCLEVTSATQANLLREIFGNPYRPIVQPADYLFVRQHANDECWGRYLAAHTLWDSAWRTPDVLRLAQTAYDNRDWCLFPFLADALEEAGCIGNDLFAHLRHGQTSTLAEPWHARGCWVLDLILGKS